ncbi:MAG: hypothetical protein M3Y51_06190 [Actinomycetota bacterium]|nr:hypothetical protein [Actinomycetota bacterium]
MSPPPVDPPPVLELPRVRCAPFHQALQVDPVGSAAHSDAFLCVEVPLPWERDIGMHEPFSSLVMKGGPLRWRPLGLVPTEGGRDRRTVLAYTPTGGVSGEAERSTDGVTVLGLREWSVAAADVLTLCTAIVEDDADGLRGFESARVHHDGDVVDLLVCTHGRRDTCCGGPGTTMFEALAARDRSVPGLTVRTWRTSHLGGHRFAPTMVSFPDAYAWAHLDVGTAVRIALRDGAAAELAPRCRGRSTVPGGPAQVAEREGLVRHGWTWLDARVTTQVVGFDRQQVVTTVQVTATWPDGASDRFDVDVELSDHVPQPTCGVITGPEFGVEPVWSVIAVRDTASTHDSTAEDPR